MTLWTILIATHAAREKKLRRLLGVLMPQAEAARGRVTVQALWNNGERPLGQVRQDLLDHAASDYISFIDDDDLVPGYHVAEVLPLLDGVDYIGWQQRCWVNGTMLRPTIHSLRYDRWSEDSRGYYRDISHLNPVRRDLTAGTSFGTGWPEDQEWAGQMRGRLKTEHFIAREMYYYWVTMTGPSVQRGTIEPVPPAGLIRPAVASPWFSWHPASTPEKAAA